MRMASYDRNATLPWLALTPLLQPRNEPWTGSLATMIPATRRLPGLLSPADVERIGEAAEAWAREAEQARRVRRLIAQLEAIRPNGRPAPIAADWRDGSSPNRAGEA